MIRIVVLGDVNLDIHSHRSDVPAAGDELRGVVTVEPGGAAATFARTAARLGASTTLIGAVGDDWVGGMLARSLEESGVHVDLYRSSVSSGAVLTFHDGKERSMVCSRGANDDLTEDWVRTSQIERGDHLHVSGYTLLSSTQRTAAVKAFALAAARGMTVSVDPPPASLLTTFGSTRFLDLLPDGVWLFPNLTEGRLLSQRSSINDIIDSLSHRCPVGSLTLGDKGAVAWSGERRDVHTLRSPVSTDTTGAGDVYAAGFVTRFLQSQGLEEANAFACHQARALLLERTARGS